MVIVVSEQVFLVFNVWLARDTRWKLLSECFAEAIWSYCGGSTQNQVVFRLFEKSRPLWRPKSAGLCAGINPFIFHAGCQEQASGKTGTWQTEMQLPAGDEDHPVGSWTFPDDSRSCLWWMSKCQVSFMLFTAIWMFIQKPTTRWRKVPVLPVRPGEFGKT